MPVRATWWIVSLQMLLETTLAGTEQAMILYLTVASFWPDSEPPEDQADGDRI